MDELGRDISRKLEMTITITYGFSLASTGQVYIDHYKTLLIARGFGMLGTHIPRVRLREWLEEANQGEGGKDEITGIQ